MAVAATRVDVERQKRLDEPWGAYQAVLQARIVAAVVAQQAIRDGHLGAVPAFRQALVDLAAVCELLAEEMPTQA